VCCSFGLLGTSKHSCSSQRFQSSAGGVIYLFLWTLQHTSNITENFKKGILFLSVLRDLGPNHVTASNFPVVEVVKCLGDVNCSNYPSTACDQQLALSSGLHNGTVYRCQVSGGIFMLLSYGWDSRLLCQIFCVSSRYTSWKSVIPWKGQLPRWPLGVLWDGALWHITNLVRDRSFSSWTDNGNSSFLSMWGSWLELRGWLYYHQNIKINIKIWYSMFWKIILEKKHV
jgi:hypothetical protein